MARRHSTKPLIEAQKLFDEGFSYEAVSKQLGINKYTVRAWHDHHIQGRLIGLGPMKSHAQYTQQQKLAAVELFLSGASKTEVMVRFGISNRSVLSGWVARYREAGPAALAPKPKGRPKRSPDQTPAEETDAMRIKRLEMEVEVLKKYNALLAAEDYAHHKKRKSSRH